MSGDYERYGNALNLTPEQARNRRQRREHDNATVAANHAHRQTQGLVNENRRLLAEIDRLRLAVQREGAPLDAALLGKAITDHRTTFWANEPCDAKCAPDIASRYATLRESKP